MYVPLVHVVVVVLYPGVLVVGRPVEIIWLEKFSTAMRDSSK
jgi:hypothetical protein|tara:strand:+ start:300 stop:425 length:126 start_codon:yes stop_codon:yes gene_type:complete